MHYAHCRQSCQGAWHAVASEPHDDAAEAPNVISTLRANSRSALRAVTVQLANELKGEGFTFVAMHPGTCAIVACVGPRHCTF